MINYSDIAEDQWDDDFVFDNVDEDTALAGKTKQKAMSFSTEDQMTIGDDDTDENMKSDDGDSIPNIGFGSVDYFDDIFRDEDLSEENCPSTHNYPANSLKPPLPKGNSRSDPNIAGRFREDYNQNPSEARRMLEMSMSHSIDRYKIVEEQNEEEDDDDDWDSDFLKNELTPPTTHAPAISFADVLSNSRNETATTNLRESLLEYLETSVQRTLFSPPGATEAKDDETIRSRSTANDSINVSSTGMKSFYEHEESKFVESANQHLKGLLQWVGCTKTKLTSAIDSSCCGDETNARTLMQEELLKLNNRHNPIRKILERCEENPRNEQFTGSLERVVRWLRGISNVFDDTLVYKHKDIANQWLHNQLTVFSNTSSTGTGSKSERSGREIGTPGRGKEKDSEAESSYKSILKNSNSQKQDFLKAGFKREIPSKTNSLNHFDEIFGRCDYLLSELADYTNGKILALHSVLLAESRQQQIEEPSSTRPPTRGNNSSRAGTVSSNDDAAESISVSTFNTQSSDADPKKTVGLSVCEMFHLLANHCSVNRMKLQMLEIKMHMYCSGDFFSNLEKLHFITDELDTSLNVWVKNLRNFLLPAGFPKKTSLTIGRKDIPPSGSQKAIPSPRISYFVAYSPRTTSNSPTERPGQRNSTSSGLTSLSSGSYPNNVRTGSSMKGKVNPNDGIYDHPYTEQHADTLISILLDLQASCLANKMLIICNVSPLSFRKLDTGVSGSHGPEKRAEPGGFEDGGRKGPPGQILHRHSSSGEGPTALPSEPSISLGGSGSAANRQFYFDFGDQLRRKNKNSPSAKDKLRGDEAKRRRDYNAFFELSIGQQFMDLMELIQSPSGTRSKLSYAAFVYLKHLQEDQLPWQKSRYRLSTRKPSLLDAYPCKTDSDESIHTPQYVVEGAELSQNEFEMSVLQSFESAFGPLDEKRILQLLLYESSVDLFPHYKKISSNSAHTQSNSFNRKMFHFGHTPESGGSHDRSLGAFSQDNSPKTVVLSCIFSQVPVSLNLEQSMMDRVLGEEGVEDPFAGDVSSAVSTDSSVHQSAPTGIAVDLHKISSLHLNESSTISGTLRHELFDLSLAMFSNLAHLLLETSPSAALDLFELSIILLSHLNRQMEKIELQKVAVMLAVKLERRESSIKHGREVLAYLQRTPNKQNEMLYMTNLLASEFSENAQHELAVKTILSTIMLFNNQLRNSATRISPLAGTNLHHLTNRFITGMRKNRSSPCAQIEFEKAVDPLLQTLGNSFMQFGCPDKAADVFQVLLSTQAERPDCLMNDSRKVCVLSWLLEAYFELEDYETCNRIVKAIKAVRADKLQRMLVPSKLNDFPIHRGEPSAPHPKEFWASTDSRNQNPGSIYGHNTVLSNDKSDNASVTSIPRSVHSLSNVSRSSSLKSMSTPGSVVPPHKHMKYELNLPDSKLPKFCVTSYNTDLGYAISKIHFRSRLYVPALKSITPTIIGVELVVGGKAGSKKGMMELADLYYFRGRIQLEASRSSSNVKYPFEVGSAQLFAAVQRLSADLTRTQPFQQTKPQYLRSDSGGADEGTGPVDREGGSPVKKEDEKKKKIPVQSYFATAFNVMLTCKRTATYNCPADLLWDAMKWFRRAWDLYHAAGDQVNAAKSANAIAECHLLPTFVPHLFFQVPLDTARDLSSFVGESPESGAAAALNVNTGNNGEWHREVSGNFSAYNLGATLGSGLASKRSSTKLNVLARSASLEEVERVASSALDICLESCLPFALMESYLNLAELNILQGNNLDALAFWWETKELFLYLFADGCLIPLVRRATLTFIRKALRVANRLVRFLWICDRLIVNQNLFLLDLHLLLTNEAERARRRALLRARRVSQPLADALQKLIPSKRAPKRKGSHDTVGSKLSSVGSFYPATAPQGSDLNKKVPKKGKRGIRGFFSGLFSRKKKEEPRSPPSVSELSFIPKVSDALMDVGTNGGSRARSTTSTPRSLTASSFHQFASRHGLKMHREDRDFYNSINKDLVAEKIYDFSWREFISYDKILEHMSRPNSKALDSPNFAIQALMESTDSVLERQPSTAQNFTSKPSLSTFLKAPTPIVTQFSGSSSTRRSFDSTGNPSTRPSQIFEGIGLVDSRVDLERRVWSMARTKYRAIPDMMHKFIIMRGDLIVDESAELRQAFLEKAEPLDPFVDFSWMDESYSSYATKTVVAKVAGEDDLTQAQLKHHIPNFLYLPEFDEAHAGKTKGVKEDFDKDYLQQLDRRAETVLVQRIWSCYTSLENSLKHYRGRKYSMEVLRNNVRNSLCSLSLNMHRLRAFSRQYKGKITSFDELAQQLRRETIPNLRGMNSTSEGDLDFALRSISHDRDREYRDSRDSVEDPSPKKKSSARQFSSSIGSIMASSTTTSASGATGYTDDSDSSDNISKKKAVQLQHRLPHLVYLIHVDNLLMLYRPEDGSQHIQLFGGAGYITFSHVLQQQHNPRELYPQHESMTFQRSPSHRENNSTQSSPMKSPYFHSFSRSTSMKESPLYGDSNPAPLSPAGHSTSALDEFNLPLHFPLSGTEELNSDSFYRPSKTNVNPQAVVELSLREQISLSEAALKVAANADAVNQQRTPAVDYQFHPMFDVALSESETGLLFDLGVKETDDGCSGGPVGRREVCSRMKNGILAFALKFLRSACDPQAHRARLFSFTMGDSMRLSNSFIKKQFSWTSKDSGHSAENEPVEATAQQFPAAVRSSARAFEPVNLDSKESQYKKSASMVLTRGRSEIHSLVRGGGGIIQHTAPNHAAVEHPIKTTYNQNLGSSYSSSSYSMGNASQKTNSFKNSMISVSSNNGDDSPFANLQESPAAKKHQKIIDELNEGEEDPSSKKQSSPRGWRALLISASSDARYAAAQKLSKSKSLSKRNRRHSPANNGGTAPLLPVPLTLLCSRSINSLPWEVLLPPEVPVVRALTLLSMCSQVFATITTVEEESEGEKAVNESEEGVKATGSLCRMDGRTFQQDALVKISDFIGPSKVQKPLYVVTSYEVKGGMPSAVSADLKARDTSRRSTSSLLGISSLLHPNLHIRKDPRNEELFRNTQRVSHRSVGPAGNTRSSRETSRELRDNYSLLSQSFLCRVVPTQSPLLRSDKLNTTASVLNQSELTVRGSQPFQWSGGVEKFWGHSLLLKHMPNPLGPKARDSFSTTETLKKKRTGSFTSDDPSKSSSEGKPVEKKGKSPPFPVLLLSYVDWVETSDTIAFLSTKRHDAVFVFSPLFIIEKLALEIKLALERWCRPDIKIMKHSSIEQNPSDQSKKSPGGGFTRSASFRVKSAANSISNAVSRPSSFRIFGKSPSGKNLTTTEETSSSKSPKPFGLPPLSPAHSHRKWTDDQIASEVAAQQQQHQTKERRGSSTDSLEHVDPKELKIVDEDPFGLGSISPDIDTAKRRSKPKEFVVRTESNEDDDSNSLNLDTLQSISHTHSSGRDGSPLHNELLLVGMYRPSVFDDDSADNSKNTDVATTPGTQQQPTKDFFISWDSIQNSHRSSVSEPHPDEEGHPGNTTKRKQQESMGAKTGSRDENEKKMKVRPLPPPPIDTFQSINGVSSDTTVQISPLNQISPMNERMKPLVGSPEKGAKKKRQSSLRAKEKTYVYHAVMYVVRQMQEEHAVPIVVIM